MKRNIYTAMLMAFATMPLMAQETYQDADLETGDLNGTARYVGMGGAMEALGADISTIGTNPAGIGMFRKSWFGTSFGMNIVSKNNDLNVDGKTVASFDQAGFVFSSRQGDNSWLNFGVNYHKSRDFNQILSAANRADKGFGSQNCLTYLKIAKGLGYDSNGDVSAAFSIADALQEAYVNYDNEYDEYGYYLANGYELKRDKSGYIGEYDINLSGNQNNTFYWGLTVGIKDVHYSDYSQYNEQLVDASNNALGVLSTQDDRIISGQGFNIKGGIIVRPIEGSPFRFGLSVASPTFYELTSTSNTDLYYNGQYLDSESDSYKFKLYTPWKFGASLGHTIDNSLALGLSYEFSDYGSMDDREITDEYYDSWSGTTSSNSVSDKNMNQYTKQQLKGVSTLKVGAEYKIDQNFSLRLGYNYVSPIYKKEAKRGSFVESYGNYYSSTTDYTNWKDTHRITAGFGYTKDNFSLDIAYMFTTQKGTFYPFAPESGSFSYSNGTSETITNNTLPCDVKNDHHKIMMTLGVRL